ncbi:MAG: helix-turn-helix domain-containing protein [Eubacteriales bacterium]
MICALNENIKQLRMARNWSQVEFAKLVGVTKQCISNWENDNIVPSIEMLVKIADLFRVSTDYLLGRSEKAFLDVSELTTEQIAHISLVINDITELNKEK